MMAMVAIRAVVSDIGGVLCRTPRTHWQVTWAKKLGMSDTAFAEALRPVGTTAVLDELPPGELEAEIARAFAIATDLAVEITTDIWHEYLGSPNSEMIRFISALRPRYRTALLSNSLTGARERERAAYGFERICEAIFYSHEIGLLKPDPAVFSHVTEFLEVRPSDVLFVDDVEENVEAARVHGWSAIQFMTERQAIGELSAALAEET